ncbi:hypothetical protein XENOCAPTIV_024166 [Xenoophorus captivus]|uniref:Uncharacterized protein n=1 Tax=Xenoophorus captivus TaxID=1517983 RepID=A0ABV0QFD8_9TELE
MAREDRYSNNNLFTVYLRSRSAAKHRDRQQIQLSSWKALALRNISWPKQRLSLHGSAEGTPGARAKNNNHKSSLVRMSPVRTLKHPQGTQCFVAREASLQKLSLSSYLTNKQQKAFLRGQFSGSTKY